MFKIDSTTSLMLLAWYSLPVVIFCVTYVLITVIVFKKGRNSDTKSAQVSNRRLISYLSFFSFVLIIVLISSLVRNFTVSSFLLFEFGIERGTWIISILQLIFAVLGLFLAAALIKPLQLWITSKLGNQVISDRLNFLLCTVLLLLILWYSFNFAWHTISTISNVLHIR